MNRSESQWTQPELSANVFRGIGSVNPSNVGSHYSASKDVAAYFQPRSGALINAEIPISSMETDTAVLHKKGVMRGGNLSSESDPIDEKEVTARTGSPIKVKSIEFQGPKVNTKSIKEAKDRYRPNASVDYMSSEEKEEQFNLSKRLNKVRTRTYRKGRVMKA